jgi:hypothetical protein
MVEIQRHSNSLYNKGTSYVAECYKEPEIVFLEDATGSVFHHMILQTL